MQAWAYTYNCKINNLCYYLNNNNYTAQVTYSGYPSNNDYMGRYAAADKLSGDLIIPSTITYNDVEYTVTKILSNAFYDAFNDLYFTSVTIPSSVTEIESRAFSKCNNLTSVVCYSETPFNLADNAFSRISSGCVLSVPYGTRDAYIDAGWTTEIFGGGIVEMAPEAINVSISNLEIDSYCSQFDLDFSGVSNLKAYILSGFSPSTGTLVLTPVTHVPAGTGILLKGAEGNYDVPCVATDMYYSNLLKGVTTATDIDPTDGEYTNFILSDGAQGVGFYTLTGSEELAANKAYLQLPTASVSLLSRALKLVFEDETTGVNGINVTSSKENNIFYDLHGRRVINLTQGLYIINGKKVLINR